MFYCDIFIDKLFKNTHLSSKHLQIFSEMTTIISYSIGKKCLTIYLARRNDKVKLMVYHVQGSLWINVGLCDTLLRDSYTKFM